MLATTQKPKSRFPALFALGVALFSLGVEAQGPALVGEVAIKDARKECEPYHHAEIADALGSFPPIWQAASIVSGDSNAEAKWASIQPNVPDIPPKGNLEGNVEGINYPSDDPDCWWTNTKCTQSKVTGVPEDVSIMPEPRTLGYGFDDGPNCSHNAFYDYLQSQNQKASMFFIGSNVMDWPLEAKRAVTDGHEVCIHGWSHKYMTAFESPDAFAELYYTVKIATGVTPTCWRPPYGDVDDRIRAIAHGLGLRTVMWIYDSQDWQLGVTPGVTSETVDKEYQTMIDDAKKGMFDTAGTIILAHEINEITMSHAIKYYPKLKEAFAYIVPVSVGYNLTHPYVEQDFTMPNFAQCESCVFSWVKFLS
ncbi:carbohydrate esterase family 4 protein [Gymnopilus junonius]|uniref:chitin deacetylase n=1 Tax=Gymnopilus junonius TaxID=109634 RepID=A0A9P5TNF5_GYMJU|nr:carbohydrate esterase family 4 protein [Gymnopilus junonius]